MNDTNLIYGLRDPRNDIYKYIGKTTIGNGRPLSHLTRSHNSYVNDWVEELSKLGLTPYIDIIEKDIPLEKLSIVEKHYIAYYSELHGQLFNGGNHVKECINEPSILDNIQINNTLDTLLNCGEVYKIIKASTGFSDEMLADMLNVGRKTIYRLKAGETTITLDIVIRLIFFSKYTVKDVFDFYINNSNEFLGDWPDTYEQFIDKCFYDKNFIRTWCDKFYKSTIKINKIVYKKSKKQPKIKINVK